MLCRVQACSQGNHQRTQPNANDCVHGQKYPEPTIGSFIPERPGDGHRNQNGSDA